jgi:hypothetical protein
MYDTGYKKAVADLKDKGTMSIVEGKHALSFAGYNTLATNLMKSTQYI